MLDPKLLREHIDQVRAGLSSRAYPQSFLDEYVALDKQWRELLAEVDELKNKRNQLTPKGKPTPEQLAELKRLSDEIKAKDEPLKEIALKVRAAAMYLPNLPDATVPVGDSEDDNIEVRKVGEVPIFDFEPKPHDELGQNLGILDFEKAAHVSGARFSLYKGAGARLERALINFMLDTQAENGYTEVMPPVLVKTDALKGTGQLPKFSDDLFKVENSDLWLSPTAEVQLTNMYGDSVIPSSELPIKVTAYTSCFRSEAGSHGKDMRGLIRLHQFNKIELVNLVRPEDSADALEALLLSAESILKKLGLAYRVVTLCTGDLGFSATKTYDIEVWFPAQNKYREISSCSNFLDFQSRRAMIRYKDGNEGKPAYLHTLNGSGVAVGRAFAAILENYQDKDGNIHIPEALRPYMKEEVI